MCLYKYLTRLLRNLKNIPLSMRSFFINDDTESYITSKFLAFPGKHFKKQLFSKTNQWQEYKWFFFINRTDANEYKSNYRHINLVSLFHFCWLYLSTTRFASLRTKTSQANHKLRYIKISKFFDGASNKCMIIIGIRMMEKDHVHACFLSRALKSHLWC